LYLHDALPSCQLNELAPCLAVVEAEDPLFLPSAILEAADGVAGNRLPLAGHDFEGPVEAAPGYELETRIKLAGAFANGAKGEVLLLGIEADHDKSLVNRPDRAIFIRRGAIAVDEQDLTIEAALGHLGNGEALALAGDEHH